MTLWRVFCFTMSEYHYARMRQLDNYQLYSRDAEQAGWKWHRRAFPYPHPRG